MAKKGVKGYQTRRDGHYGTLKFAGKSYVSPRFPLDMDPDQLQHEVEVWRSAKRLELKKLEGMASAAPRRSLAWDIKRFLAQLPDGNRKKDLQGWLKKWADSPLGEKPRHLITVDDVDKQLVEWSRGKDPYAGSSLNHLRQSLISLWCGLDCKRRERGRCRDPKHIQCPAMQTSKFKEAEPRQGFFEQDQFLKVLKLLPPDHADFARFAYITGWRRNEISGLVWSDCDLKHNMISLPGSRTKSGKPRKLPIGKLLKQLMDRRVALREERKSPFVFTYVGEKRFKGEVLPIKDFRKRWERVTREAGCEGALMHDFRRTAARNNRRAGLSEKESMERTGHATPSVFSRYNIVSEADMREAAERVEDSLNLGLDTES